MRYLIILLVIMNISLMILVASVVFTDAARSDTQIQRLQEKVSSLESSIDNSIDSSLKRFIEGNR